jgi:hypothetical protein
MMHVFACVIGQCLTSHDLISSSLPVAQLPVSLYLSIIPMIYTINVLPSTSSRSSAVRQQITSLHGGVAGHAKPNYYDENAPMLTAPAVTMLQQIDARIRSLESVRAMIMTRQRTGPDHFTADTCTQHTDLHTIAGRLEDVNLAVEPSTVHMNWSEVTTCADVRPVAGHSEENTPENPKTVFIDWDKMTTVTNRESRW